MKNLFAVFVFTLVTHFSFGQVKDPVQWAFTAKKLNTTTYEVHLTATIDNGWHLYSQTTPEGGPSATTIAFTKNPLLSLDGGVKEVGKLEQKHEELFGVDVKQFSNKVDFVQVVKLKGPAKTALKGNLEFMTCNNQECLPPKTQKFSIALK
ncbi:protein-disulfide reductase DsbD N-terminal domain-containing protein [Chitinophagaceae bacterium LB-8]|uniref:Protein-disulfide reductase DsbD N-terminal domain-containing protein n=1 Tax=Paraflavisolibacter caeni TaxID=2982496 RepID=A0A9X2XUP2_9BACT|nr:protein-disulfide reductase DsbD domain-containing protein [Paraflavisolibacter caeni]MCU7548821.1 protein-disulfide reductase DsbD N-terminal domain-containing protein [Paraflavisolibacter caeni]